MARQDKILEVLALSGLPDHVKIARLARRWIGKPFPLAQARAVIDCYFDVGGRKAQALARRLFNEKLRQEKLRNDRAAVKAAAEERAKSPMLKYRNGNGAKLKQARAMEIAKSTFGPHVRENFNADTLALMSLISGEDRWYQVNWLDAGFSPARCALIEVVTMAPSHGSLRNRFLLYRVNRRVLVARTTGRSILEAWGSQLDPAFVEAAPILKSQGFDFRSDLEGQEMIVLNPDGTEFRRVPWNGRTVDE